MGNVWCMCMLIQVTQLLKCDTCSSMDFSRLSSFNRCSNSPSTERWRERLKQDLIEPEQRDRERESRVLARYLLRTRIHSEQRLSRPSSLRQIGFPVGSHIYHPPWRRVPVDLALCQCQGVLIHLPVAKDIVDGNTPIRGTGPQGSPQQD